MRSQLGTVHPFASTETVETGPLLVLGHPPTRGRRYMANEQLPWLIPFNQQDASGFAWRTEPHETLEAALGFALGRNQRGRFIDTRQGHLI